MTNPYKMNLKNNYSGAKLFLALLLAGASGAHAQQDPQYTQYMYNTTMINPAYAGSREAVSIFGQHRTQWVGLDGAPVTNALSIHSPIGREEKIGLGLSFFNDRIGPSDLNSISADFSYAINLEESRLAFGLKGTANLFNVDYTKLSIYDPNDPTFQNNIDNQFSPNVGAGIYWYSDRFYAGLSVPKFLETKFYESNSESVVVDKMNYYLMGGYVFELSPSLKLKPAFLAKAASGAPIQLDVSANFLLSERFVLGAGWRWDAAVSALAGFQVTDKIFIGYAYDAETTRLANYNSGSHEFFLRFELFDRADRILSPRFF